MGDYVLKAPKPYVVQTSPNTIEKQALTLSLRTEDLSSVRNVRAAKRRAARNLARINGSHADIRRARRKARYAQ